VAPDTCVSGWAAALKPFEVTVSCPAHKNWHLPSAPCTTTGCEQRKFVGMVHSITLFAFGFAVGNALFRNDTPCSLPSLFFPVVSFVYDVSVGKKHTHSLM
jgi:hypothetical protein